MPMMWVLMVLTNDGGFFSLALPQANGLAQKKHATAGPPQEAPGFHRQRQVHQATPSPWVRRECPLACLVVAQAMGVSPQHRLRRLGFAVPLPRHKDRLSKVQGVQEVAGTRAAPIVEELGQRDALALPDPPRLGGSRQRRGSASGERRRPPPPPPPPSAWVRAANSRF